MQFRPCIDIHNGKVKQIVGSSLKDLGNQAEENYVSEYDSAFFAKLYQSFHIKGGHIIMLNSSDSEFYETTKQQALLALRTYPGGLQVGGGIHDGNAKEFLEAGASHVIVTSYVFSDGRINFENLNRLVEVVGKKHLVLDLSCRKKDGAYHIVTDRWQKFVEEKLTVELLDKLSGYCDEFLIHAVDVEGKSNGSEEELVEFLGNWGKIPVTYAGGVRSFEDLERVRTLGQERLHVTIGSALSLFGGDMDFKEVIDFCDTE